MLFCFHLIAKISCVIVILKALSEILSVRSLDLPEDKNPLVGLSHLVVESVWRCHYLAFNSSKTRDAFLHAIKAALVSYDICDSKSAFKIYILFLSSYSNSRLHVFLDGLNKY